MKISCDLEEETDLEYIYRMDLNFNSSLLVEGPGLSGQRGMNSNRNRNFRPPKVDKPFALERRSRVS